MTQAAVIGLEWGAVLTGAIILADGQMLSPHSIFTPTSVEAALDACLILIRGLIDQATAQQFEIVGIGIGAHGQVSAREGVLNSSRLFKTWRDVKLVEALKQALDLPVTLTNAAQAAALLEYESGAAARASHALYLHISYTVESAYLINGAIFQGPQENSGSIGLITADWRGEKPVPLDDVVTIPGIQRLYHSRTRIDERPLYDEIAQLALNGHSLAVKAIRDTARMLGTLLPPVAALMETSLIVVGGEVPQVGDVWWSAFEAAFYTSRPPLAAPITLRQAHYGAAGVLHSVGRLALRHFLPEG